MYIQLSYKIVQEDSALTDTACTIPSTFKSNRSYRFPNGKFLALVILLYISLHSVC